MTIVLYIMYGIEVLVAVLLIGVILVQRSKAGGGLGGLATNSAGVEEAFGSSAGNVLVKATVYMGIIFLVNTVGIGIIQQSLSHAQREGQIAATEIEEEPTMGGAEGGATDAKAEDAKDEEKTDAESEDAADKKDEAKAEDKADDNEVPAENEAKDE